MARQGGEARCKLGAIRHSAVAMGLGLPQLAWMCLMGSAQSADVIRSLETQGRPDTSEWLNKQEGAADYRSNKGVGELIVTTDRDGVPADGQSAVTVTVKLKDLKGAPMSGKQYLTVETDGGRILLPDAKTDELGPQGKDLDRVTPGVQVEVKDGIATFQLLAPSTAQDVKLRVTAGYASAQGVIRFIPELREMIAAGLIEGVISRRRFSSNAIQPTRFNDTFERELTTWGRQYSNGKANANARSAFFLKGVISGQTLLTAAFDSDKETRSRMMRDIQPQSFYPVYGDSSTQGFDARSSDRLYVRVDNNKNYALYGDFTTEDGYETIGDTGLQQRKLGLYNRTATGLRGHLDQGWIRGSAFATRDRLKQVVEEYPGNGTSGPYAVRNNGAVENTEKVELVVRDKNQLGIIKRVTPLTRFVDYAFEPFDGRILLKQPIAALTPDGDPQSLRITYEVDQGGEDFWVAGGHWQVNPWDRLWVGGSFVDDKNPLSPYRLGSANLSYQLGTHTGFVAEFARTISTTYSVGNNVYTTPSGQSGESKRERDGDAVRVELAHRSEQVQAKAYYNRSEVGFNNTTAGISGGQGEAGLKGAVKVTDNIKVYGEAIRSEQRATDANREGQQIGVAVQATDWLNLDLSVQHAEETIGMPSTALIASNTAPLGAGNTSTGGFFGNGENNTFLDPVTGQVTRTFAPVNSTTGAATTQALDATTVRLGAGVKVTDRFSLSGDVERGVDGVDQHRYGAGAKYLLTERSKLYGRYEGQTGLASAYSLGAADKSNSFIAGVDSSYMPGGNVFSEYRLRDAESVQMADIRDQQLASGVRNVWNLSQGVAANTNVEYLQILKGVQQEAAAVSTGLDYAVSPLWKASAKLEWRRVFDNKQVIGDQSQNQWLNTLAFARKLNRDWTLLARNYLLWTLNNDNATGTAKMGNAKQDRAQVGFAWRPVDNNRVNGLARYEYKMVKDDSQPQANNGAGGDHYNAHIVSGHMDYHPSRPWWFTGRLAGKQTTDDTLNASQKTYRAWLGSLRGVYDLTENWDIGLMAGLLGSPQGESRQYSYGMELGYLLAQNLWLSAGYNWTGFRDRDLSGPEQTAKGVYLRLRFKFDETLFKGKDPDVNVSLDR
ncbi:Ig-like domain-containing protein [Chitinimonas sp. PSY-7]|uniref:Ig-like domain-containing protein n=1 Tax=Chitinimonas sp. PSY-7 TaxID=3459088 RepID=UPI00403FCB23